MNKVKIRWKDPKCILSIKKVNKTKTQKILKNKTVTLNYNNSINKSLICAPDNINIPGPGETDMCYGMGKMVQIIKSDFLSFFKENFYKNIVNYYQENTQYNIPFDVENSIVIHLRLDDQWWESDYDGSVCSNHYIEKINNGKDCLFTNGPNNKYNKQNPLSTEKIEKQLQILLTEFPNNKIILFWRIIENIDITHNIICVWYFYFIIIIGIAHFIEDTRTKLGHPMILFNCIH